ncbi:IPT/TIG domain-containing protein [Pyxidicoccus caerfyrddinensis]|uniref:IPT/TIG domain-containing protein n=1 Tax=Pyxidicoccus caerfyrddinensis TaxID=2709663 RepID=UPI0013DB7A4A|nr:IPT/TIG domain-containing protein [Pyxidicoccus caerfyrddinensis]
MSLRRSLCWAGLLLAGVLAAGCLDFDGDAYCAKHPELCTLSVTELSPTVGPAAGGTEVSLTGNAIDAQTVVEVGGVPATTKVMNATRLIFVTPPHPSGRQDVVVRGKYETVTLPGAFHYEPRPEVTSFSPGYASSNGGKTFTLVGRDLGPSPVVFIGGVKVTYPSINREETRITASIPPLPPGTHDVEVRNAVGGVTVLSGAMRIDVPWVEKRAGLLGGNVRGLWVNPADASHVLAAVAGAGLQRSRDGGATWQPVESMRGQTLEVLVQHPSSGLLYTMVGDILLVSADLGERWSRVFQFFSYSGSLLLAPDGALLLLQALELMRLAPGASNWERLFVGTGDAEVVRSMYATTPARIYMATSAGVFRLATGTQYYSWTWGWRTEVPVTCLAPVPGAADSLYAGTAQGLYRLDPGKAPVRLNGTAGVLSLFPDASQAGRLHLLTSAGLRLSVDSGVTWQPVAGLPPAMAVNSMNVTGGRVLAATAGVGVFRGTVGSGLTASNTGLPAADVIALAVDGSRSGHLFAGTTGGLFESLDDGDLWKAVPWEQVPPPVTVVRVGSADGRFVFAASASGLRRSRDGGGTWEAAGPQGKVWDLAVLPTAPPTVYAATDVGVQVSRDGGDTWAEMNAGLTSGLATGLAVAGPGPSFTLYVTQQGALFALTPDSTQWTLAGRFTSDYTSPFGQVAVASNGMVLVASPRGVFSGRGDGGQLGAVLSQGRVVHLIDAPEDNAFAGGPTGLWRATVSPSVFSAFTDISAGMTGKSVRSITFHPDSTRLYVGTEGFGVQVSTVRGL